MKRKFTKRLFAVTTASLILLSCSGVMEAVAAEIELQQIAEAKISDTLKVKMAQKSADKISVILWTSDLDMNEVQAETLAETTVSKAPVTVRALSQSEPEHDLEYLQNYGTDEEIQGYIEAKRARAREEYTAINQKFIDTQLPAGAEVTFISQYSPIIFAEMNASDVTKAARSSKVETVEYLDKTAQTESASITYNDTTRAAYTRDNYGLKGSGVKIGQIEAVGVPSRSNSQLSSMGSRLITKSGAPTDDHATIVATIMVGSKVSNYYGVASSATLYCTYATNSGTVRGEIEWLLSQGVNVINASMTFGGDSDNYDDMCKWVDHISASHDVHIVQAAGNAGENNMGSGTYAYNSIVVGATDDKGTSGISDDSMWSGSSYSTRTGLINKPDLSAPGADIETSVYIDENNKHSGTSCAAPQVTGVIAQICGNIPALKTQQTSVKALLIAGVNNTNSSKIFKGDTNANYRQWGAGILDANGVRFTATNSRYSRSTFRPSDAAGTTKTYTFKATSSDKFIRVALCFMKVNIPTTSSGENPHPGISQVGTEANVDLTVTGPNGFSQSSSSAHNNTEIVDITNPVAGGTYTVTVKLKTNSSQNVPFGIAWR